MGSSCREMGLGDICVLYTRSIKQTQHNPPTYRLHLVEQNLPCTENRREQVQAGTDEARLHSDGNVVGRQMQDQLLMATPEHATRCGLQNA